MDIEQIEEYIRAHSPIQKAIARQKIGLFDETRPRNNEMLLTKAVDEQKDWAISFVKDLHFNSRMGTSKIGEVLGVKRSIIRRILKAN
jgi:hypothetical protein